MIQARMEAVRFEAPWDVRLTLITTAAVIAVLLGIAIVLQTAMRAQHPALSILIATLALPGPVTIALAYWWAPRAYSIDATAVRIERRGAPIVVPLASVREVRELEPGSRMRRVLGSGGLFGYFGTFRSPELGDVRMYATRSAERVLLRTEGGTFVLTPSPADRFLAEVRARLDTAR